MIDGQFFAARNITTVIYANILVNFSDVDPEITHGIAGLKDPYNCDLTYSPAVVDGDLCAPWVGHSGAKGDNLL